MMAKDGVRQKNSVMTGLQTRLTCAGLISFKLGGDLVSSARHPIKNFPFLSL